MLNYIWAGLIIASLVFALLGDGRDIARDTFRNEAELPVVLELPDGYQSGSRRVNVDIRIDPQRYSEFYDTDVRPDSVYSGYIVRQREGTVLRFAAGESLPEPLNTIQGFSSTRDNELQGELGPQIIGPDSTFIGTSVTFNPVRFVRLNNITQAAFDFAETGATLALGLIGVLALFLGLLKIAEAAGIVAALVRFTQPIFRPLFPEIPDGHPALGMIVLNLTANMLGLGNAATPLGIRAMEELQTLNPEKGTATNSMVMLLALNTASVQLVPPTLLVAVMGLQVNELILPIIVVTFISAVVAITSAKLLQRLAAYRATDPHRNGATVDPTEQSENSTD
jgi:spore maturation protein A